MTADDGGAGGANGGRRVARRHGLAHQELHGVQAVEFHGEVDVLAATTRQGLGLRLRLGRLRSTDSWRQCVSKTTRGGARVAPNIQNKSRNVITDPGRRWGRSLEGQRDMAV